MPNPSAAPAIVRLRQDLRLADNPALQAARRCCRCSSWTKAATGGRAADPSLRQFGLAMRANGKGRQVAAAVFGTRP